MKAIFSAVIATVALTPSGLFAEEWTHHWQVGSQPELRVHSTDASIQVEGGGDGAIDATVSTTGWKLGRDGVQIVEHQTGDAVDLDVRLPHMHLESFLGHRDVRVTIRVPKQLRADLHTTDGSMHLSNLGGTVRAESGDGSIEAERMNGTLEARSGDGSIHIDGRLNALQLHTGDGSVTIRLDDGSKVNTSWRIETGDGSIRFNLPRDFAADLELRTGDGGIHVDEAMQKGVKSSREHEQLVRLNNGGPPVVLRTQDGSITVGYR